MHHLQLNQAALPSGFAEWLFAFFFSHYLVVHSVPFKSLFSGMEIIKLYQQIFRIGSWLTHNVFTLCVLGCVGVCVSWQPMTLLRRATLQRNVSAACELSADPCSHFLGDWKSTLSLFKSRSDSLIFLLCPFVCPRRLQSWDWCVLSFFIFYLPAFFQRRNTAECVSQMSLALMTVRCHNYSLLQWECIPVGLAVI